MQKFEYFVPHKAKEKSASLENYAPTPISSRMVQGIAIVPTYCNILGNKCDLILEDIMLQPKTSIRLESNVK